MRRLPPLNALRAFEAAARHLSFTRAADELSVTPGAISQQVKLLEDIVGVALFRRDPRGLQLTDVGHASLPALREGFDSLAVACRLMTVASDRRRLVVSVAPSFASKWLVPRLAGFQSCRPDIDVDIRAEMSLADFAADGIDVAIRYGAGNYPGLTSEFLLAEQIIPVCAPTFLDTDIPITSAEQLLSHTLLHDAAGEAELASWEMWLRAAGVEAEDIRGPRFNQSSLVVEAAVAGRGIALAKYAVAEADLNAGRLVIPFDIPAPTAFSYWIVHPAAKAALPEVRAFKGWLQAEAGTPRPTQVTEKSVSS
ncbi:MAG: transcriptional regulator GcvA [Parvularcula sp.]